VTLTNTGNLNLAISAVAITGANPADFAKLSDTCSGASVVPGASCAIGVAFAPTINGPRAASLTVTDNAAGGSQSVALSGTGVAPANNLSFTTTFANQAIGSSSPANTLRITNTGSVNEVLGSVGIVGANAGDFAKLGDTCSSATLVPGATCDIAIAFVPTAVGARSAIVSVPSAIAGTSQTMALRGVGI
jgi:hypothetical protein